jgi:hypothetical protein
MTRTDPESLAYVVMRCTGVSGKWFTARIVPILFVSDSENRSDRSNPRDDTVRMTFDRPFKRSTSYPNILPVPGSCVLTWASILVQGVHESFIYGSLNEWAAGIALPWPGISDVRQSLHPESGTLVRPKGPMLTFLYATCLPQPGSLVHETENIGQYAWSGGVRVEPDFR